MAKAIKTKEEVIELTEEQKIMEYIDNHNSDKVDLAPVIKSLYPMPTQSAPAVYLQQGESKRLRGLLGKMKADGSISIDDSYLKLGSFYYVDGDTKTKYHNIETVKVIASK